MSKTRALLVAVLGFGVAAAASSSLTYSAFTARTTNASNAVSAGTVSLTDNDLGGTMLGLNAATPGSSDTSCIRVTYNGTLDAAVRMYVTLTGSIAPYLTLTVTRGSGSAGFDNCTGFTPDATNHIGAGQGVVYSGLLSAFPTSYATGLGDPVPSAPERWTSTPTPESHDYKLVITLNDSNAAQGLSGSATFNWEARDVNVNAAVLTTPGLVGYWRFDESSGTLADDAYGTNNGTYTNGVTLGSTSLLTNDANAAATFDGLNDYVTVPDSAALSPTSAISVEAWVKPSALDNRRVASKDWILRINPASEGNGFAFFVNIGGAYEPRVNSGVTPNSGSVYHVVGTYDSAGGSGNLKVYVNGELKATQSRTGSIVDGAGALNIGGVNYWSGVLDEVAVYNVALTAAQVKEHYAGR